MLWKDIWNYLKDMDYNNLARTFASTFEETQENLAFTTLLSYISLSQGKFLSQKKERKNVCLLM